MKKNKVLRIVGRVSAVILITLVMLVGTLFFVIKMISSSNNPSARNIFISTVLESGQLKFLASWFCSEEEIAEVVNANKMESMNTDVDTSLININNIDNSTTSSSDEASEEFDENGIRLVEISGRSFLAKMLIIKDPSQVKVGSTYPWSEYGKELDQIVSGAGAIAGVNGGLYVSTGNKGGTPLGVVVQDGSITYNSPGSLTGLYMIGMTNDNLLIIKDLEGMSASDFENYVSEAGIRDAVAFQEESSDSNNHFVPLIINGIARKLEGQGSGANPRTVIGQRADGAIMLLVTDGRGASGHLGATASDLIAIMQEYGAVNAANLDGGSSSTMVYNGNYEMASVTFYYQNSSWKLPTAFVVMPK